MTTDVRALDSPPWPLDAAARCAGVVGGMGLSRVSRTVGRECKWTGSGYQRAATRPQPRAASAAMWPAKVVTKARRPVSSASSPYSPVSAAVRGEARSVAEV